MDTSVEESQRWSNIEAPVLWLGRYVLENGVNMLKKCEKRPFLSEYGDQKPNVVMAVIKIGLPVYALNTTV